MCGSRLVDQEPTVYHVAYVIFHGLVGMIMTCFHMLKRQFLLAFEKKKNC